MSLRFLPVRALLVAAALAWACAKARVPPEAKVTAKAAEVPVGAVVELDGAASLDPNEVPVPLSYRWNFRQLPAGSEARLNDATIVNPSFTADVEGTYVVGLVVAAGDLPSAMAEVTVKAGPCGASRPQVAQVAVEPQAPRLGQAVLLSATVTDADNDAGCESAQTLRYEWWIAQLPAGSAAKLNLADAQTPSFTADLEGDYVVALAVTDSTGRRSAPSTTTIAVSGCGGASPVVQAPVATPATPHVGELVSLSAEAADADNAESCGANQTLSYKWFFVSLPQGSRAALNDAGVDSPSFVPDLAGIYVVRARVEDGTGRSTLSAPLSLEVSSCGSASPAIAAIAATPAGPITAQVVQLTADVSDSDADETCAIPQSFSYAWRIVAQPAGSRAALNNAAATNPSFTADVPGDYAVELVVTDQTGRASAPTVFDVEVSSCASATPSAAIALAESASIGATVALSAAVTDADTDVGCELAESFSYAWSFVSVPAGSAAQLNASDVEAPSFMGDVAGEYVVGLVVTDRAGHVSALATATVEVTACGGAAPVATPSASANSVAPGTPVLLTAAATDADNDESCAAGQTFAWRWSFASLPAGSTAGLNQPAAKEPSFTPDVPGDYVVRLVAVDSTGRASASASLTITATACGTARPVAAIAPSSAAPAVGETVLLTASATDVDNDEACAAGQSFTWEWAIASLPAGSGAALNEARAATPSFTPDVAGTYVVRLVAVDSAGLRSEPVTLELVADACGGNAPSVSVAQSPASVGVGMAVRLAPTVTDADNDATCQARTNPNPTQGFTYAWTLLSTPAGSSVRLSAADAREPSFIADRAGDYVARLVVTDSTGRAGAPVEYVVAVDACGSNAPAVDTVEASDTAPLVGEGVLLTATFDDADNGLDCSDILDSSQAYFYEWSIDSAPAGSTAGIVRANGLEAAFAADVAGTYVLRFTVTDETGLEASDTVAVEASPCGTAAPTAAPAVDASSTPRIGGTVFVRSNATDSDDTCGMSPTRSYHWWISEAPAGSAAFVANPSVKDASFSPDLAGTYVVSLQVTDSTGRTSATSSVTVAVTACGGATPVAGITGPISVLVNNVAQVTGTATDADVTGCSLAQSFQYEWQLFAAPSGSTAWLTPTASVTNPSLRPDRAGPYVLRLRVTDSTGRTSPWVTHTITAN